MVLGVSRNGYYQHVRRQQNKPSDRLHQEMQEWIKDIAESSKYTYGSRRMKKALKMKARLVCDALSMAIRRRRPKAGLIHHSDRGSQYASKAFRRLLKAHGIKGSMSRKGDCWDNAVVESFFGTLKQEVVQWRNYQTRSEAQQDILEYIAMFYNGKRLHSYLGYVSPNDFERLLMEQQKAA